MTATAPGADHDRVARTLRRLAAPGGSALRLDALAADEGVDRFRLNRAFLRWAGLSPKRWAAFADVARAKGLLAAARSVLDVALDLGLSGPSRLHDRFVRIEAMSPGEWAAGGAGLRVAWGVGATPLGRALVAWTPRGICRLAFLAAEEPRALLAAEWPAATLVEDAVGAAERLARAFPHAGVQVGAPLSVLVHGSDFQLAVWRALVELPPGSVTSYAALAMSLGRPRAARAVGQAVGANAVACLIPCHRVIAATGLIGGYRWGAERKIALLAGELHAVG